MIVAIDDNGGEQWNGRWGWDGLLQLHLPPHNVAHLLIGDDKFGVCLFFGVLFAERLALSI